MAGQHENQYPRPDNRTVAMFAELREALEHIRTVEYSLGLLPAKPRDGIDWDVVAMQLADARAVLGKLCLELATDGAP